MAQVYNTNIDEDDFSWGNYNSTKITLPNGHTVDINDLSGGTILGAFNGFKYDNIWNMVATGEMVAADANYYFATGQHLTLSQLRKMFPAAGNAISNTTLSNIRADVEYVAEIEGVDLEQLKYKTIDIQNALSTGAAEFDPKTGLITYKDTSSDTSSGDSNNNNNNNDNTTEDLPEINSDEFGTESVTPKDSALKDFESNPYYTDTWSLQPGTTGYSIYNNLTNAERNAATANMQLADAQYQNAAMQQAATVKSITDQVRSERMAKLRAGMNEAQIANQDMQMMMSNINAMNDQMNAMNYSNLQAQQQYNLAQDTAYQEYLTNAQAMNQTAAANYAAQAGDATYAAKWLKNNPGMTLYYDKATGQYKTSSN